MVGPCFIELWDREYFDAKQKGKKDIPSVKKKIELLARDIQKVVEEQFIKNEKAELHILILTYWEQYLLKSIGRKVCEHLKEIGSLATNRKVDWKKRDIDKLAGLYANRSEEENEGQKSETKRVFGEALSELVNNALKYGVLSNPESKRRFVIAFCDFTNSTELLNQTAACFFRSFQNKLLSRLSETIIKQEEKYEGTAKGKKEYDKGYRGYIDKFNGDNIMFYFPLNGENNYDRGEWNPIISIHNRVMEIIYRFQAAVDEFLSENKNSCPLCDKCASSTLRSDCMAKFRKLRSRLGLRIGMSLTERPIYQSVLGLSTRDSSQTETDFTFTGDDVNLAARMENLREETMLSDLDQERQKLELYASRLYDVAGRDQTSIMKRRERINVLTDDIKTIAGSAFSIRVNGALHELFLEYAHDTLNWRELSFLPKGFNEPEKIYIACGNECKRLKNGTDEHSGYRYLLY